MKIFPLKNFAILTIAFISFCITTAKSNMPDKSTYYYLRSNFYVDIFSNLSPQGDSLDFIFLYDIDYDNLVFQLNDEQKYFAVAKMEITFKDENGITRKRIITNDTVFANNYDETISKKLTFKNLQTFTLQNSNYNVQAKLLNGKNKRTTNFETKIEAFSEKNRILYPYFLKNIENEQLKFIPFIRNNSVAFSSAYFSILVPAMIDDNETFKFLIKAQTGDKIREVWGKFDTIAGETEVLKNHQFTIDINAHNPIISLENTEFENKKALLKINLENTSFSPGTYELIIENTTTQEKHNFTFEVRWDDIPLSLSEVQYAVNSMYYILTDAEFSDINSGNNTKKYKKIIDYWKKFDPDPKTIYNEAMATYFNRVDYAFFNYRTLVEKDGAKTDRGKIYILNGAPDKIENDMTDKSHSEIWYYYNLRQKYTFNIISVGNYKLKKIEDIE